MEKILIKQTDSKRCGNAVAKMYLALIYRSNAPLLLEEDEILDDFLKIRNYLLVNGLSMTGRRVDDYHYFYKIKDPMIIQVRVNQKDHYVLIKKSGKYHYHVNDPGYGYYRVHQKELMNYFTGYYLIGEKAKFPKSNFFTSKIKRRLLNRHLLSFFIFHALSMLMLFLALVIFNQVEFLHYAIILGAFSFITFLISRQSLFKLNSVYDEKLTQKLETVNEAAFISAYQEFHRLKSDIIHPLYKLVTSIISTVFIIFLIGVNDYYMFIPIIYLLISLIFLKKRAHEREFKYFEFDNDLIQISRSENRRLGLETLNKKSKGFITQIFNETIVGDIILFSIIFIVMLINEVLLLNYLVFHFSLLVLLKSNLNVLFFWKKQYSIYFSSLNRLEALTRNI